MTSTGPKSERPDASRNRPYLGGRVLPQTMDDASTHSSILRDVRPERAGLKWIYYRRPVATYLIGLGCPEQDVEDLTHEMLIKLHTYIVFGYDPGRPFRPYFKTAVRNLYFDHLRARNAAQQAPQLSPDGVVSDDPANDELIAYARDVYQGFAAEAPAELRPGAAMLQAWLVEGAKQEELARDHGLTDRQVRNHLARAADALAAWMHERVNAQDLDDLARMAERSGVDLRLAPGDLRGLFSHMSRRKRMRALLVLAYIHRRVDGGPS